MDKELTNKEKIILVIKESVRFAKLFEFNYEGITAKHKEISSIEKLNKTINEKLLFFNNLHEESNVFQSIFNTAKVALKKIQTEKKYNYYSAELIIKVSQLEKCFIKRLNPIGIRIIEQKEISNESVFENQKIMSKQNKENENNEPLTKNAIFLKSNVSGQKFSKNEKERKEIIEALKNNSLNDTNK